MIACLSFIYGSLFRLSFKFTCLSLRAHTCGSLHIIHVAQSLSIPLYPSFSFHLVSCVHCIHGPLFVILCHMYLLQCIGIGNALAA